MSDGMYAAVAGAIAEGRAMDVVANNLANVATAGFKGGRISFRDVLAQAGGVSNRTLHQVAVDRITTNLAPGLVRYTGSPLDVALQGPGFFVVETSRGERLTRAGTFGLSPTGQLITADGLRVLGTQGPLTVSGLSTARIDRNGVLWDGAVQVGRLRVTDAASPNDLTPEGARLWQVTNGAKLTELQANLVEGSVEQSNVNAVTSMTELVQLSRAYESFNRIIEIMHAADQKTTTDLGH